MNKPVKKISIDKIAQYYGFNTLPELYDYVIESRINGNPSQVKEILNQMGLVCIVGFIKHLDKVIKPDQDTDFCRKAAYDIIDMFDHN